MTDAFGDPLPADPLGFTAVAQQDDGTWDFRCPRTDGSCAPFVSSRWPTKESATARGREHLDEHEHATPMTDLEEFRQLHGLTVNDQGQAVVA